MHEGGVGKIHGSSWELKYKKNLDVLRQHTSFQHFLRIVNLIKDKDEMQKNLPSFYEKLSELKLVIDHKYDDILSLKEDLREYERLKMQIEELTNENNN